MYKPGFILPVPAWGGGDITTNQGLGAQAGYTYLLGGVPIPYAGLRVGGRKGGVSLSGPLPMLGIDMGKRTGSWESHRPRSIYKLLGDKMTEIKARKAGLSKKSKALQLGASRESWKALKRALKLSAQWRPPAILPDPAGMPRVSIADVVRRAREERSQIHKMLEVAGSRG